MGCSRDIRGRQWTLALTEHVHDLMVARASLGWRHEVVGFMPKHAVEFGPPFGDQDTPERFVEVGQGSHAHDSATDGVIDESARNDQRVSDLSPHLFIA